jgi:hypothetical protein
LFQRVCEDRQIDTFQTLAQALQNWIAGGRMAGTLWTTITFNYPNLRAAFNGGLYGRIQDRPHFCETLRVNDRWLEDFIDELSGDDSNYLFNFIPIEILGSGYERFLGSVLDGKGNVKLKPEVRHSGGVYYTPQHIVDGIVDRTVGERLEQSSFRLTRKISRFLIRRAARGRF